MRYSIDLERSGTQSYWERHYRIPCGGGALRGQGVQRPICESTQCRNFLRSGSLEAVASRADVELLADLRNAAQFVIDHAGGPIDAGFVRAVNATVITPIDIPKVSSLKFVACEQQTHLAVSVSRRASP